MQVFLAGGVPEVMLHLRARGLLETQVLTRQRRPRSASSSTRGKHPSAGSGSATSCAQRDGIDPDDVIMSPELAAKRGLTSTVCFPRGNLAPEGAVIKSTSIDPSVLVGRRRLPHHRPGAVFTDRAVGNRRDQGTGGDPAWRRARAHLPRADGRGMEETYQLTSALKHLPFGKHVALITDARFCGVSTGACIGHVVPEALAGGPIGKVRDGDLIRIVIDRAQARGHGRSRRRRRRRSSADEGGAQLLAARGRATGPRRRIRLLPDDTRLWAALQDVSGGTWGGCVYDVDAIVKVLAAGKKALETSK